MSDDRIEWVTITDSFRYPTDFLPEGLPIWDELVYERYQRQAASDRALVNYLLNIKPDAADRPSLWTRITPYLTPWAVMGALCVAFGVVALAVIL